MFIVHYLLLFAVSDNPRMFKDLETICVLVTKTHLCLLGNLPVLERPTNLDNSRARAYCACSRCGWDCLDFFSHLFFLTSFSLSLIWEAARYALQYCIKGPLTPPPPPPPQKKKKKKKKNFACLHETQLRFRQLYERNCGLVVGK